MGEHGVPYVVSSYESFVARRAYRERLLAHLGLPPADVDVYDANDGYYEPAVTRT